MKNNPKKKLHLRQRIVCHQENGLRAVPIEKTIQNIEKFFLHSPIEVQFTFIKKGLGGINRAILKFHAPNDKSDDKHYFGKGLTIGQNIASASFEFFERYCARMSPGDEMTEASYREVANKAVDPQLFDLGFTSYNPTTKIDWVWGYSLTKEIPLMVPANLVFLPYRTEDSRKYIVISDSNGLASGNNLEEAILHALLEVIERDQVNISEYNRLPFRRILPESVPEVCHPLLENLNAKGFRIHMLSGNTDIPIPFMAVFLQHCRLASRCAVAYGTYPDPTIALERALTEAVQMLPPSASHKAWLESGSPQFFQSQFPEEVHFNTIQNLATHDIRENIKKCVSMLKKIGSEVFVVDLSRPEIPFPAVRVIATRLQPRLNIDSMRLSDRFSDVPVKLGFKKQPTPISDIKLWAICGYR